MRVVAPWYAWTALWLGLKLGRVAVGLSSATALRASGALFQFWRTKRIYQTPVQHKGGLSE